MGHREAFLVVDLVENNISCGMGFEILPAPSILSRKAEASKATTAVSISEFPCKVLRISEILKS